MDFERKPMFYKIDTSITAEPILAMAFVNIQPLEKLYSLDEAFREGTLYKNLNKPFLGGPDNA